MDQIILAIIIVAMILFVLIILFSFTIKRVNILTKKAFVSKLQQFDSLISDRELSITKLNAEINVKKEELNLIENNLERGNISNNELIKRDRIVKFPSRSNYADENILNEYKKIKKAFDFNSKHIIERFMDEQVKNQIEYFNFFKKIRCYFDNKIVYKICCFIPEEQAIIVENLLNPVELAVLTNLVKVKNFNINEFVMQLDQLIVKTNPEIQLYISDEKYDYGYLNKNIKVIYDDSIAEGFKIVYKGIVYDYSI